jgi:hypothetical protein
MVVMLFANNRRKTSSSGQFTPGVRLSGASRERAVYEFLGHPGSRLVILGAGAVLTAGIIRSRHPSLVRGAFGSRPWDSFP